jgi:hypothetical protein
VNSVQGGEKGMEKLIRIHPLSWGWLIECIEDGAVVMGLECKKAPSLSDTQRLSSPKLRYHVCVMLPRGFDISAQLGGVKTYTVSVGPTLGVTTDAQQSLKFKIFSMRISVSSDDLSEAIQAIDEAKQGFKDFIKEGNAILGEEDMIKLYGWAELMTPIVFVIP